MLADVLRTADSREQIPALERQLVGTEKPCHLLDVYASGLCLRVEWGHSGRPDGRWRRKSTVAVQICPVHTIAQRAQ